MLLTDQIIETFATPTKPTRLTDGGGLYMIVNPNGSKYWRLDYRFGGKRKTMSMGVYPDTGLSEARESKDKAKKLLSEGVNPVGRIRAKKPKKVTASKQQCDSRFLMDDKGALSMNLDRRSVVLTPPETTELRAFLKATEGNNPVACSNHHSEPGAQDQKLAHPPSQDAQPLPQLQDKRENFKVGYVHVGTRLVPVEIWKRKFVKFSLKR